MSSGLLQLWNDTREFAAAISLARPAWLWLALVPLLLVLLEAILHRRQRNRIAAIGRPESVSALIARPRRNPRAAAILLLLAWVFLVLGAAGPRWGTGDGDGAAVGRDLVLVLDLSRSMLAEDMTRPPARWQAAILGLADLLDTLQTRGGNRVALVLFAAKPLVVVPLTTDLDHLRSQLAEIDMTRLPLEIRAEESSKSGTRIGAAIRAALEAHDPRFVGSQDIVLISDGDDPVPDREWVQGITAARLAHVPVHTIGVGDPEKESPIFLGGNLLEFPNQAGVPTPVLTRLNEETLRAIAEETGGRYLPARRDVPTLGAFFREEIEPYTTREFADELIPQPRSRTAWFLGFGLILLALSWWKGD